MRAEQEIALRTMDFDAYDRWPSLSLLEKLPYLLDERMIVSFRAEYDSWIARNKRVAENQTDGQAGASSEPSGIQFLTMMEHLSEFLSESDVMQYFKDCDVDRNESIDFTEYVVCRGIYDAYANPHGISEYDFLESILIHDFEEKMNDPNVRLPGYKYDENGIIID
jgi:hypothetical protein